MNATRSAVIAFEGREWTHLAHAIAAHVIWCRGNGVPIPLAISEFASLAKQLGAMQGQAVSSVEPLDAFCNGGGVSTPLLLTYPEAARRAGLSLRSLKRLVAAGTIPTVVVGTTPRVRAEDLERYVSGLGPRPMRDSVTVKGSP